MPPYTPPPLPDYPETQFLTLPDGRKLAFVDYPVEKPGAEGATSLFFHGGPGSRMLARIFHDSAKKANVRILSFDRAGYGRSTPNPSPTFSGDAQDAKLLLEHLGIAHVVIMGMSAGGPSAAATAALLCPEMAKGLVLVSAVAPTFELGGLFSAFAGMNPVNAYVFPALASMPASAGNFLVSMLPALLLDEKVVETFPEPDRRVMTEANMKLINVDLGEAFVGGERGPAVSWKTYLSEFRNFNDASAWGFKLSEISVPSIIIHGDADKNVPLKHGEHWSRSIPKAELLVSEGEGHFGAMKLGHTGDFCPGVFEKMLIWCGKS